MMTKKIIKPVVSAQEAVKCVKAAIMVGGFNYGRIPYTLVVRCMMPERMNGDDSQRHCLKRSTANRWRQGGSKRS